MILTVLALAAASTVATAVPVLAGGGGGSICDGFARGDHIRMHDSCFAGTAHIIDPDADTLTVTNDGAMPHTITAADDSFDLYVAAGETVALELPDDAVIPVYCTLHGSATGSGMAGVIVRDAGAGATRITAGTDESAARDETATVAELAAAGPASPDGGSDGIAVVAIIVAGLAAALALAAALIAIGARRGAIAT
jgi:hypothetical protein